MKRVDFSKPSLYCSPASIAFIIVARDLTVNFSFSFRLADTGETVPAFDVDGYPPGQSTGTRRSQRSSGAQKTGVTSSPSPSFWPECYGITCTIFLSDPWPLKFTLPQPTLTRFHKAIAEQPHAQLLPEPLNTIVPPVLIGLGQLFVITSTWQLGITGTFLGDYFGILMDHRVEGFPFNVLTDPMYVGSTMTFVGASVWFESPVGLLISLYVYIVYVIALRFEG